MLLVLVFFILIIFLNIVYYSFRYGITPMPSSRAIRKAVEKEVSQSEKEIFIDLGSGWGWLCCWVAKKNSNLVVLGYEISFVPYLFSLVLKKIFKLHNLFLYRKDFSKIQLNQPAIYYCYLYTKAMPKLEKQLANECHEKCIVISNTFSFPQWKHYQSIRLKDLYATTLYFYKPNQNKWLM